MNNADRPCIHCHRPEREHSSGMAKICPVFVCFDAAAEPPQRAEGAELPTCEACGRKILHSVDLCQIDGGKHGIIELDQHCWRMFGEPLTYAKVQRALDRYREIQAQPDAELRAECNGSCDIALARRQVGPDGVVPGNARECAELWEREASRLKGQLSETEETLYMEGNRAAWLQIFQEAARMLGYDKVPNAALAAERESAVAMLRQVCREHGDNDWPEDLHLADVIEKHLWRHLD